MKVGLLVEGGNMTPGPALAQKLGPLGMNIGKIISDVNTATASFKGMKVPVDLDIDPATKEFSVKVRSPPVPELLKKEVGLDKGSGDHKKLQVANIAIEQAIKVAKTKLPDMLEKDLKQAVKTVVGCCASLGIMVENKPAVDINEQIDDGKFDDEINNGKTEISPEKKKKVDDFFKKISTKQQAALKAAEKEKEEAEAKAAAKEGNKEPEKEAPAKK